MLGCGAVVRECFLPAFAYLKALPELTVIDQAVPREVREAYLGVDFLEGEFGSSLDSVDLQEVRTAVVALPNQFHEEAVVRLLTAGVHVLCEKPLALTEASCLRMKEAARQAGRRLSVNMVRRFIPSVRTMLRLVREGEIGRLEAVKIEHGGKFTWPAQSLSPFLAENGGVFSDMGIHYLDLAELLTGQLQLASYLDDSCGGVEAESVAEFTSISDVAVHIHLSRLRNLANKMVLRGTRGKIELSVDALSSFKVYRAGCEDGLEVRPLRAFRSSSLPASFQGCFVEQLQHFRAQIEADDISTDSVEGAARAARIIEQAYQQRALRKPTTVRSTPFALKPASALITGVTGFIGGHLVKRLFEAGFTEMTGIVRHPQTCASAARFPVTLQIENLLDFASVRKAVQGRRYVFHLAYGRDGVDADAVTVQGTKNVVNAAIEAECETVLILSTVNVFGWPDGEINESAPYRPTGGAYGRTKAIMERWCLKRARKSTTTRIVILSPSCVYGPRGRTFTELPAELAREHAFAWISDGQGIANYVYIDNLIDAIFLATLSPRAHGQRFIINDGWTTWREFLVPIVRPWLSQIRAYEPGELARQHAQARHGAIKRAILAAVANDDIRRELKKTMFGAVSSKLMRSAGLISSPPRVAHNKNPDAPPQWTEDLFGVHKTKFSSAKARSTLGWTPRVNLREGQRLTVEYLRERGLHPEGLELALGSPTAEVFGEALPGKR